MNRVLFSVLRQLVDLGIFSFCCWSDCLSSRPVVVSFSFHHCVSLSLLLELSVEWQSWGVTYVIVSVSVQTLELDVESYASVVSKLAEEAHHLSTSGHFDSSNISLRQVRHRQTGRQTQ